MAHNKAPKQGSVRCALSAGRAYDARPLARRYKDNMKFLLLLSTLFYPLYRTLKN